MTDDNDFDEMSERLREQGLPTDTHPEGSLKHLATELLGTPAEFLDENATYAGSSVALRALDEQDRSLDALIRVLIDESPDTELGAAMRRVLNEHPEILVVDDAQYREEVAQQAAGRIGEHRAQMVVIDETRDYGSFERSLLQKLYFADHAQFGPPRSGALALGMQMHQNLEDFYVRKGRAVGKSTNTHAAFEGFLENERAFRATQSARSVVSVGVYPDYKKRARAKAAKKSRRKNRSR